MPGPDLAAYVPRVLLEHLAVTPDASTRHLDGTLLHADVSGFTRLSEKLSRRGPEGAEQLSGIIGECFAALLAGAYAGGGSLLKFGGDALLLLFDGDGHAERACRAAVEMRRTLRTAGRITTAGAPIRLRMSVGLHSGPVRLFVVGGTHRELLVTGPAATAVVAAEHAAGAGEIVVGPGTAARLPASCLGPARGGCRLLRRAPAGHDDEPAAPRRDLAPEVVAAAIPAAIREHLLDGPQPPEHRAVTVAFVRFEGIDALVRGDGFQAAAVSLDELMRDVEAAAGEHDVAFLSSDVDADGGKLILAAGAPRATGDDEERMLLALRQLVQQRRLLPIRAGVHRGPAFAGDIGPAYRRTYTVMGDTVNLAARLMAAAPPGHVYATAAVLDASRTTFDAHALEPLQVKGKLRPVLAFRVGPATGSRARGAGLAKDLPLLGRDPELAALGAAVAAVRCGHGRIVEIAGELGIGKSRLARALREQAALPRLAARCEAYTASTPYAVWHELLRPALGVEADADAGAVLAALRAALDARAPELRPWLPLLAIVVGVEAPPTAEVAALDPAFRRQKLHEVVRRLLDVLLPAPVHVEIEDADAMDEASAALLTALADDVPDRPWLVAVTRRDGETGFRAPAGPAVVRVTPGPLAPEPTMALAEAATESAPLPPHLIADAVERSGGNPQFLEDLLRAAVEGDGALPDSIAAAAAARIDRLSGADRAIVRHAAVFGLAFRPEAVAELLADQAANLRPDTWTRLWRYFEPDGQGQLRFRRAVVRDVAYAGLAFRRRRVLHARAAAILEREAGAVAMDAMAALSLHRLLGGDAAGGWRDARRAAELAHERFAHADAARLYRRALDAGAALAAAGAAPPPAELAAVWEGLGDAHVRTGEPDAAKAAFAAARRVVAGDAVREAHLLHRMALVEERGGRVVPAVRRVRGGLRALEDVPGHSAGAVRSHLIGTLASVRRRQGRVTEAIALCRQAIAEAEAAGDDTALARACYVLDWALVGAGRGDEAVHSARALAIYERLGDLAHQGAVLNNLGGFAYEAGRWDEAVALYTRSATTLTRAGDLAYAAFGDCNVGEVLSDQGRLDEAELRLRSAIRVWRGMGDDHGVAFATLLLGRTAVRAGRPAEGIAALEAALAGFRALRVTGDATFAEVLLAEAWAFEGSPRRALDAVNHLERDPADAARHAPIASAVRGYAMAQLADPAGARAALEAAADAAAAQGRDFERAVALHAILALGHGAAPAGMRRERDAVLRRLRVARLPDPPLGAGARLARGAVAAS